MGAVAFLKVVSLGVGLADGVDIIGAGPVEVDVLDASGVSGGDGGLGVLSEVHVDDFALEPAAGEGSYDYL